MNPSPLFTVRNNMNADWESLFPEDLVLVTFLVQKSAFVDVTCPIVADREYGEVAGVYALPMPRRVADA